MKSLKEEVERLDEEARAEEQSSPEIIVTGLILSSIACSLLLLMIYIIF